MGINEFLPYNAGYAVPSIRRGEGWFMRSQVNARRWLGCVAGATAALVLLAAPLHAEETDAEARKGWEFTIQSPYGFASGGAQGSYYFQTTPGTAFGSLNGTRGFTDLSIARNFGLGRELGIGNTQITAGVRTAEPLIANGFTPSLDPRRFVGSGPRLGLAGDKPLDSSSAWRVEWQVGAAMLFNDQISANNTVVSNYATAPGGSLVNVDGLLGLSYFFNAASKLTVGYRADAYFKGSSGNSAGLPPPTDHIDHGPMVRFTIQK